MNDYLVTVPARFNGPPTTGNGGYSSGLLGAFLGAAAEVTLRTPPPLDREMTVRVAGAGAARTAEMLDADVLVGTARVAEPGVACPAPLDLEAARTAERAYRSKGHPFPTCFVCGPDRAEGDGLRLFTGRVDGSVLVASSWTPSPSVGTADGFVEEAVVWSALDCPTYFGAGIGQEGKRAVLGRFTVKRLLPVRTETPHVVVAWPVAHEGRKWEGGSAIFTADGTLCAFARGLWIEPKA